MPDDLSDFREAVTAQREAQQKYDECWSRWEEASAALKAADHELSAAGGRTRRIVDALAGVNADA